MRALYLWMAAAGGGGYPVRTKNLPGGQTALQFTRAQMDRLGLGQELTCIPWNKKHYKLPPSTLSVRNH